MKEIIFENDRYHMNWLREDFNYGEVRCPRQIAAEVVNVREGDCIDTEIRLKNISGKPFFSDNDSIGIAFPLQDRYESSQVCLRSRCHTHLFCGGDVSYILALRMGGEAPHLGMVLTEGALAAYSVERDTKRRSNDRGCFFLHPCAMEWEPGETKEIRWRIFPHQGKEDFIKKLGEYGRYVRVEADRYVLFAGESGSLCIRTSFPAQSVRVDGRALTQEEGVWSYAYQADELGEHTFHIEADGIHTWCKVLVHEQPAVLAERRCRFIAQRQQYRGRLVHLRDAYLAYDNEEKHMVYTAQNDYNGGRERVGMGLLMAEYLKMAPALMISSADEERLMESLHGYTAFVMRELVDTESGRVCNDIGMDDSYRRLYNAPWYAGFFISLYELEGNAEYLVYACRIIRFYYSGGGKDFYPIELPVHALYQALVKEQMQDEAREMRELFVGHADRIAERGTDYPSSEVNYEQSIVAPAAAVLLEVYRITGEERYLREAERQIEVLELFNGIQPDYHLYETAIRHWDGYWFGKYKLYGDTFPHYWSALTGEVFALYGLVTGKEEYLKRAEDSRRGVLPLIFADGSASCAYVYPCRVNGVRAGFYDPYANDQDWGLYFYLRAGREER